MSSEYVPAPGDLIWIDFSPQGGREQAGRRPALVLSPFDYNRATGLVVCCAMSRQQKGYAFEVPVRSESKTSITGVVLADHIESFDWRKRNAERAGIAPAEVLGQVRRMMPALLGLPRYGLTFESPERERS